MFEILILVPFLIIYALICYGCVRLFGKNNGLQGYRYEATLATIALTPFLGIPLINYLLGSD